VEVGVEFFTQGVKFGHRGFFEGGNELPEGQFDAGLERFGGLGLIRQRGFEAVLHRQQFTGKSFGGKLVRLGDIFLGAPAQIFGFGLGAQPGVVMLGSLQFR
jgi:hypothetical protein